MNLPFHFTVSVNYHSDHGKVQVRCWRQTLSIDAELKLAPILEARRKQMERRGSSTLHLS